jgi:toxin-antitoxin system PIN domain toxin
VRLLDVNVVLAAHRTDHPHYGVVGPWFTRLTSSDEQFWVPEVVWVSFVRIATHRRVFEVPTSRDDCFAFVRAVAGQPGHVDLTPSERAIGLFESWCHSAEATGDLVPDAYLAALATDHACTLVSLDRDFARFEGLSWERPS